MRASRLWTSLMAVRTAGRGGMRMGLGRRFGGDQDKLIEFAFQNKDGSLTVVRAPEGHEHSGGGAQVRGRPGRRV
jgi:hypothetical protein